MSRSPRPLVPLAHQETFMSIPHVDPRGPRFGAALTTIVLIVVLLTGSAWLLAAQALVFALGASLGVARSP